MIGLRANIFNENFLKEADQDANSVLIELDKGLRSVKIGEQCEAIIRFPKLFEKYPYPVCINWSFLKLSEVFRIGSNLSRLWVLRVCQQSEKHLEKILNVEEFVKRIFMVIHSNDPVARALTLRTLGSVACVIPEKQQVHHAIRNALDSHDAVEVEAAIFASVQFAAQSKSFAVGMCSKVASMIENLQTPLCMKIHLIPVLRHMYHDANTAALVRTLCRNLLPKYPSEQFVIAILQSLSHLSYVTFVDIPDQVDLLITYLGDPRKKVQHAVLLSLNKLAKRGAYLWPQLAINNLLKMTMQCSYPNMALNVIITLTACPKTCSSILNEPIQILEMCEHCLMLEHSGQALTILTSLVSYGLAENVSSSSYCLQHLTMNLEYLMHSALNNNQNLKDFRVYLICGIRLSKVHEEFGERFAETIADLLVDDADNSFPHLQLMCEALGAVCSVFSNNHQYKLIQSNYESKHPFRGILPSIIKKLDSFTELTTLDRNSSIIIELLASICLQVMLGSMMPQWISQVFYKLSKITNYWTQYRIARSASRYGQHFLAATIYQGLTKRVSSESLRFYLTAMGQISKADCVLCYGVPFESLGGSVPGSLATDIVQLPLLDRIDKGVNLYCMAWSTLIATSSPEHPMSFQSEVITLRCHFLLALYSIVVSKNSMCITPPSAISSTLALSLRDPLLKFGHVTNQLRKNTRIMKSCEQSYDKLLKKSLDADPCSLEYLKSMKFLCSIFQSSIEVISFLTPADPLRHPPCCTHPETNHLLTISHFVTEQLRTLPNEVGLAKTITSKHMDILMKQIEVVTKSPFCMPRYFFQALQNTPLVVPQAGPTQGKRTDLSAA
ncbi:integrator complex subunit 7 [Malaya genurostris]|uniref:integrator complex subunit 7 n=1 Tax=Malaya genurostris TaxID=325434 RepID=UPI0026F3EE63|nr:integrator complex subunit 7 [Malaya genurostris]